MADPKYRAEMIPWHDPDNNNELYKYPERFAEALAIIEGQGWELHTVIPRSVDSVVCLFTRR